MDEDTLEQMFGEGMTGIRLNLSHMMLKDHEKDILMIRRAASKSGITPKILVDLIGPELRIGDIDTPIELIKGEEVIFYDGSAKAAAAALQGKRIPVTAQILGMLKEGEDILLNDGKISVRVGKGKEDTVSAVILRGGILSSRKSITIPGANANLPALTAADRINIKTAVKFGITGVMQPFVRGKRDLLEMREAILDAGGTKMQIFAKVENMTGVEKLEELIEAADEIVIARGDLGNAMPLWELPGVQKRIAAKCNSAGRRFMVVTQMLASMEHAAVPTRAEVSDIYNAVLDGAASVMVTGETAVGEYPVEVIRYLKKTAM